MDRVLREAVAAAGGLRPLARKLGTDSTTKALASMGREVYGPATAAAYKAAGGGITPQAIHKWQHCPPRRVVAIERATGVPRERLRPDLYVK